MGGPGPIPWSDIDRYAERKGIVEDDVLYEDLVYYITQMDQVYLEVSRKAMEKDAAKSNGPNKGPSNSEW